MKKLLPFVLILALLAGCGSAAASESAASAGAASEASSAAEVLSEVESVAEEPVVNDNRTADPVDSAPSEESSAEASTYNDADFEVTAEYLYEGMFGTSLYFLAIQNNSDAAVEVNGNATALDADGNAIGADSMYIDVLGPGEESIGYFYFDDVSGIDKVDYQLSYSDSWYEPVLSELSVDQTLNDSNVTLNITNNGSISAQFVEAYALFMDADGNVIDYESTYFTDNDSEIKPGATISGQLDCYEDAYDHVAVYLVGRSDGSASQATASSFSDEDFDVTGYLYEGSYGSSIYFVTVKNNSQATVSVGGNATAKDADGNSIGAANLSIDVLGPGEESIGYFYFGNVSNIDTVDYQLMYSEDSFYDPVVGNLSVEVSVNDTNVVVTATNNGDIAAEFVEAYVLFFDADGNVVDYDESYIVDNDYELKPDATLSTQANAYEEFDHVGVYLTGRGGGL
jgi:archaellum component FlaF (FlaF/FlaG flagellin family)